jgi:hypothetical protein
LSVLNAGEIANIDGADVNTEVSFGDNGFSYDLGEHSGA